MPLSVRDYLSRFVCPATDAVIGCGAQSCLDGASRDYDFLDWHSSLINIPERTNAMTTRIAVALGTVMAACLLAGAGPAQGDDLFRTADRSHPGKHGACIATAMTRPKGGPFDNVPRCARARR